MGSVKAEQKLAQIEPHPRGCSRESYPSTLLPNQGFLGRVSMYPCMCVYVCLCVYVRTQIHHLRCVH